MRTLSAAVRLSRLPFLLPGLAPFTAGVILGLATHGSSAPWGMVALGYAGVTLIMLITYYSNEYFDYYGDVINRNYNKFSGGTRVFPSGLAPRSLGLKLLAAALITFALLLAVYMRLYYQLRPYVLPMSLAGLTAGLFYSTPPLKWAYRGLGEVLIGFSYGWLATVSGFYIVAGTVTLAAQLLSLPAAFTVFSLIVINEIPDYEADVRSGKRNLVVRLGVDRAKALYLISNVMALVSAAVAGLYLGGLPGSAISTLALSPLLLYPLALMIVRPSSEPRFLERLSAVTIAANAIAAYPVLASLALTRWIA